MNIKQRLLNAGLICLGHLYQVQILMVFWKFGQQPHHLSNSINLLINFNIIIIINILFIYRVIGSTNLKKVVYSLDWFKTNDRYILLGCDDCSIILYDAKEMKNSWELNPFKQSTNLKIQCVKCGPSDSTFVCSLVSKDNNKLLLYDVKTKKIEVLLMFINFVNYFKYI